MIAEGEAEYNKWRHPDPYIGKWWNANKGVYIIIDLFPIFF